MTSASEREWTSIASRSKPAAVQCWENCVSCHRISRGDRHAQRSTSGRSPGTQGLGLPAPFVALRRTASAKAAATPAGSPIWVNLMRLPAGNWSSQRHCIRTRRSSSTRLEGELVRSRMARDDPTCRRLRRLPEGLGRRPPHDQVGRAVAVYLEVGSAQPATSATCSDIDMYERQRRRPVRAQGRTAYPRP